MNIRDDLVRRGVNRVARLIGKQSPMRLELTSMPFVDICSTIELPVHIMDEETQLPYGRAGSEFYKLMNFSIRISQGKLR